MINTHLCTVKLCRRVLPGLTNYRLDTVADHFSIPIFDRHRAGSDALATAEVFLHLLTRLKDNGVQDLAGARKLQAPEIPELKETLPDTQTTSSHSDEPALLPATLGL
jgi:DNA polymerase III epsilon subunit-like protein